MSDIANITKRFGIHIGSQTDIGGGRENQDNSFIHIDVEREICIIGVLDGHGSEFGTLAALSAKKAILNLLTTSGDMIVENPAEVLTECFKQAHKAIRDDIVTEITNKGQIVEVTSEGYIHKKINKHSSWSLVKAGSTCSIIAIIGRTLYSTNVGDSDGLLFSRYPVLQNSLKNHILDAAIPEGTILLKDSVSDDMSNYLVLSGNHSPENISEFDRMRKSHPNPTNPSNPYLLTVYDNSRLEKYLCEPVFDTSSGIPVKTDKSNYIKNVREEPGIYVSTPADSIYYDILAMTRSLGDYYIGSYGVSYLPEIKSLNLDVCFNRIRLEKERLIQEELKSQDKISIGSELDDVKEKSNISVKDDSLLFCIVLATDGFWDNWIYDQVQKFVMDSNCLNAVKINPEDGAQRVVNSLIVRNDLYARKNFGSGRDNATGIVMYITLDK